MNTDILLEGDTFTKPERLCSTKSIDRLFASGESFVAYPLRVVYFIEESMDEESPRASVLASVSKKKFKRAVKRNRVKRLIREAYRLNKSGLLTLLAGKGKHADITFLYLKDSLPEYAEMEKAIKKTIAVLSARLKEEGMG